MPHFRQNWQQRSANTQGNWQDYEQSYRYGFEMRNRPEYRGRTWNEVEPEFRRDWSAQHPTTPWDQARESVRESWESTDF